MIPDRAPSQEFVAGGTATQFDYAFPTPDTANVHVAINGVEQTSGFTVSSASTGSGFVTFDVAPTSGSTVTVWRLTPIEQKQAFGTGSAFYPKQVEKAFDTVHAILQEIRGGTAATAGVPEADLAHSAWRADRAEYAAYAAAAGTASEAGSADTANSASFADTAGGLTTSAMNALVSVVAGAVVVESTNFASSAGGLTSAAMSSVVSSAAGAVNVTSVSEAGVASSLTAAAKSDIVNSAAAGGKLQLPEWPAGSSIAGSGGFPHTWTNNKDINISGESFVAAADGAILMVLNFTSQGKAAIGAECSSGGSTFSRTYPIASCGGPGHHVQMAFPIHSGTTYTLEVSGCSSLDSYIEVAYNTTSTVQTQMFVNSDWTSPYGSGSGSGSEDDYWVATSSSYGMVQVLGGVSSATSGSAVVVPTVNAMIDYVAIHGGGGGEASGGTASYASSAGGLTTAAMNAVVNSAAAAVTVTSVSEAGVASSLTSAAKADILASAGGGGSVTVSATYGGPFAVTASGSTIAVAGGKMYLGGTEYAVASSTLTSSNGTVYYYVYYSSGSYYSGCSVAGSASALAAVIRGSQGYYTALANVQGGNVTQCHYGDIRIDGRVQ